MKPSKACSTSLVKIQTQSSPRRGKKTDRSAKRQATRRSIARAGGRVSPPPPPPASAAYPAPSRTYAVLPPPTSSGPPPPPAPAAVAAAMPDRHHASQVRSAANRVRRVTSSSAGALTHLPPRHALDVILAQLARNRADHRSDHHHERHHEQPGLHREGDADEPPKRAKPDVRDPPAGSPAASTVAEPGPLRPELPRPLHTIPAVRRVELHQRRLAAAGSRSSRRL